jgi:hypothetical protein
MNDDLRIDGVIGSLIPWFHRYSSHPSSILKYDGPRRELRPPASSDNVLLDLAYR